MTWERLADAIILMSRAADDAECAQFSGES